ncbi:hypothetical protein IE53DRAFT_397744, partial [Violaceomyces palustris]
MASPPKRTSSRASSPSFTSSPSSPSMNANHPLHLLQPVESTAALSNTLAIPRQNDFSTLPLSSTSPANRSSITLRSRTSSHDGLSQSASSSGDANEIPAGIPSSKTYTSLSYAPRQRHSALRPSIPTFQSHSSQFDSLSRSSNPSANSNYEPPSPMATSPSTPSFPLSNPDSIHPQHPPAHQLARSPQPAATQLPSTVMARVQLQQLREEAKALGLNQASAGWILLESLQAASQGEWAAMADLAASGEATILLPKEPPPPSSSSSSSGLSLSFAYDHVLFSSSQARPCPSQFFGRTRQNRTHLHVTTLSGLRGHVQPVEGTEQCDLLMKSFIPRSDLSFIAELRDKRSKSELLSSLGPLPVSDHHAAEGDDRDRYPTFTLSSYNAELNLPPPPPPPVQTSRSRKGSTSKMVNSAGSRASASFASLFGGSARDRRRGVNQESKGSELIDASKLGGLRHNETGSEIPQTGPDSDGAATAEGASSESEQGTPSGATTPLKVGSSGGKSRTISVWVVDRLVRRNSVLRDMSRSMEARIRRHLQEGGIPDRLIEVVCSFSAMFLPPTSSLAASSQPDTPTSASARSPMMHGVLSNPPYLTGPDEMSDNFQEFFTSVRAQLEETRSLGMDPASSSSSEARSAEMDERLERIESVVCREVFDRIFCPSTSRDALHDTALSSRIAALNILGLSLGHLGLEVPDKDEDGGEVGQGLAKIVESCGEQLLRLDQDADSRSPKAKLDILVKCHKIVVDGLGLLPKIKLKDEAVKEEQGERGDGGEEEEDARGDGKGGDKASGDDGEVQEGQEGSREGVGKEPAASANTSSADLILPILIFSIVTANPPKLASNLFFIQRFRADSLVRGEASYCLVNFQAAVAFLENVDPHALGLGTPGQVQSVEEILVRNSKGASSSSAATAMESDPRVATTVTNEAGSLSMPLRIRGRLGQEIGELAGVSNKVITGVMGSSLSAFGRIMGAGYSNETWDKSRAQAAPKTLEEIKGVLQGGSKTGGAGPGSAGKLEGSSDGADVVAAPTAASLKRQSSGLGIYDHGQSREAGDESDGRSVRSLGSEPWRQRPKSAVVVLEPSGSNEEGRTNDNLVSTSSETNNREKLSIGDRLASIPMLGRLGGVVTSGNQNPTGAATAASHPNPDHPNLAPKLPSSTSPSSSPHAQSRELPGPPPPAKPSIHQRTGSYLASLSGKVVKSNNSGSNAGSSHPVGEEPPQVQAPTKQAGIVETRPLAPSPSLQEMAAETIPASLQSPYPPLSRPPLSTRPLHVVLASTGSVASIKIPLIVEKLLEYANVRIQIIASESSLHFYDKEEVSKLNRLDPSSSDEDVRSKEERRYDVQRLAQENLLAVRGRRRRKKEIEEEGGGVGEEEEQVLPRVHVWTDRDEWSEWNKVGDPILHIELRRWADVVLVAPCSANTLAKIHAGICDSLLTCFLRALSPTTPTMLFPAMNTLMYMHPLTSLHVDFVKTVLGYQVHGPIEKRLACGDLG